MQGTRAKMLRYRNHPGCESDEVAVHIALLKTVLLGRGVRADAQRIVAAAILAYSPDAAERDLASAYGAPAA